MATRFPITAPPAAPPRYGLVAVAPTFDQLPQEVFGHGYTFDPETCGENRGGVLAVDCDGLSGALSAGANPAVVSGDPFVIYAWDECSTFGFQARDYVGRAQRMLRSVESYWLARELWKGSLNLAQRSLADTASDVVTSGASTIAVAMAAVEAGLAYHLRGGVGMVHLTPQALVVALGQDLIYRDGALWRTAMGHLVVADAGFDGSSPAGVAPGSSQWIYGTSPIAVALGPVEVIPGDLSQAVAFAQATDRAVNTVTVYAHRPALWIWDECAHVAAQLDLAASQAGVGS